MPAPRPSIIAITAAKVGRPSGADNEASRSCPAATPASAPISVAIVAATKRTAAEQHNRDQHAHKLADGGLLLGRQVDQIAAGLDLNLRLGILARRDQRLAVLFSIRPGR